MVKLAFGLSSVLFAVAIHVFFNESLIMFDRWLRPTGMSARLKQLSVSDLKFVEPTVVDDRCLHQLVVNTCSFALLIAEGLCTRAPSRPHNSGDSIQPVADYGDDWGDCRTAAVVDATPCVLDEGQFSKLVVDDFLAGNTTGGIALVTQSR
ncbi:hypothetical protein C8Q78DRAFT_1079090 [Trametes maxima]|nr:hypothetical protein C8Q78DRAFT_1079090 [Trametes maxima]